MSGNTSSLTRKNRICFLNKHTAANNEFKIHSHNCYEIIYFLSGGEIAVEGIRYPVTKDTCCIIPPNTEHNELLDSNGEIAFIGFKWEGTHPFSKTSVVQGDRAIGVLFERIIEEYANQNYAYEIAAEALFELLLIMYIRLSGKEGKRCKDMVFIKSYIEQYYNQKIDFSELAKLSGYSYDYFRYVFKKEFGLSPQNYMINIRVSNAEKLLKNTKLSCTEIAYTCGFSNSAQMTFIFKNKLGKTPMELRKNRLV